jgi:hypothetical protein
LSSEQGICHLTDAPDVPEPWEHQRREIDHTPLGFDPIDIPAYRALIICKVKNGDVGKPHRIVVLLQPAGSDPIGARHIRWVRTPIEWHRSKGLAVLKDAN